MKQLSKRFGIDYLKQIVCAADFKWIALPDVPVSEVITNVMLSFQTTDFCIKSMVQVFQKSTTCNWDLEPSYP